MVLAHRLTFWADAIPTEPESILDIKALIFAQANSDLDTYIKCSGYQGFANTRHQLQEYRETEDLIHLLGLFQDKQCANPRDRVYSLLAFCSELTRVPVNYEINLHILAIRVLRSHRLPLCICTTAIVSRALGLKPPITGNPLVTNIFDEAWVEFEVPESSARTERLEGGNSHHCIDLSWVCGCFDGQQNGELDLERNPLSMIVSRHENSGFVFRLSLTLLPKLLPYRVRRCKYSRLETRPAKGGLISLGYGALYSGTTSPPHLVTILGN
jgi:hypothetical protein